MRGADETSGLLFSYVDLETRIPAQHPLRKIRQMVNGPLASLDAELEVLYTDFGRPSIPPERLIRASLLQILFSVRSERQLMKQMQYVTCCSAGSWAGEAGRRAGVDALIRTSQPVGPDMFWFFTALIGPA
jgi:hypothetical protein